MKKLILTAGLIALLPASASAQLLGGGGLGGGLGGGFGGTLNGSIGSTLDSSTRSVRNTIDQSVQGTVATDGEQSVDTRNGSVSTNRSASGSIAGSTASLADLAVLQLGSSASGSASGNASGQGNADADVQLIGTDTATNAIAPIAGQVQGGAGNAAGQATGAAQSAISVASIPATPMAGLPSPGSVTGEANGSGGAEGNSSASLISSPLVVAGSAASAAQGAGAISPGMPVTTPEGASLGRVEQIFANGRGEVQQVVVSQGDVSRTLPAGMFTANGNALVAGNVEGQATSNNPTEGAQPTSDKRS